MHIIRSFILAAAIVAASATVSAQQTETPDSAGIAFSDLSLADALEKARAEQKIVFIDCFTKTCGPCKMMANKVFPQKECGDYFNPAFVSLKRDMDEGEGPEIARKYTVRIYPTFLFILPDGTQLLRYESGAERDAARFVQKIDNALKVSEMTKVFASGNYSDEFLREYLDRTAKYDQRLHQNALATAYAGAPDDVISSTEVWGRISGSIKSPDNGLFRRLLAERSRLASRLPSGQPDEYLLRTLSDDFRIRKAMNYDFDRRLSDAEILEADSVPGAAALSRRIRLFDIVLNRDTNRLGEIADILAQLPVKVPDPSEQLMVITELERLRNFIPASGKQRERIKTELQAIADGLPEAKRPRAMRLLKMLE